MIKSPEQREAQLPIACQRFYKDKNRLTSVRFTDITDT